MNSFTHGTSKEDGSMISNLPLLFSNGFPTSLDKIKLDSLERFIPFMLKCSLKGEGEEIKKTPPKWWDSNVPYKIPLERPKRTPKWVSTLKRLVYKCYTYHGCLFILDFCKTLSTLPIESLNFTKNFDGTTSLYNIPNGKLLVTFRNENRIYDNSYKNLLPRQIFQENHEQMPEYDIYLCDNCDEEFFTLKDANDHEKLCCFKSDHTSEESENTIENDFINPSQDTFLNYLKLKNNTSTQEIVNDTIELESTYKKCKKKQSRNPHFSKYSSIAISSPLGIMIQKRRNGEECFQHNHIDRIDRFCSTKTKNLKTDYSCTVSITFKKKNPLWTHTYKFKRKKKSNITQKDKYENSKKKTDRLLKECKPVKIMVKKLREEEINYYTRRKQTNQNIIGPSHTQSPIIIDLCSTDDELETIHEKNANSNNSFEKFDQSFERQVDSHYPEKYLFRKKTQFNENEYERPYNMKQYYEPLKNIEQSNQNEKKLDTVDRDIIKKGN